MDETTKNDRSPEALRTKYEEHLMSTFHEQRVLFEEGRIRVKGQAVLVCDDWGVTVNIEPETVKEPFTVSGAWEILSVWKNRLGAAYVGWGISPIGDENDAA